MTTVCQLLYYPYSCRSGDIVIFVLPTFTDEPEETFTVSLIATTNNVIIDSAISRVVITVQQNGSPFGVISFLGDVIGDQRVNEETTSSILSFPLVRIGDFFGAVQVSYSVSRVGGVDPVEDDVRPASGSVVFPSLQGRASLDLTIVADGVAEAEEAFIVTLTTATGGATVNALANSASFVIKLV